MEITPRRLSPPEKKEIYIFPCANKVSGRIPHPFMALYTLLYLPARKYLLPFECSETRNASDISRKIRIIMEISRHSGDLRILR